MRKLLWVSLTGLTLLAGGVTTAYLAIHHPDPVPDRLLNDATATPRACHQAAEVSVCAGQPVSTDLRMSCPRRCRPGMLRRPLSSRSKKRPFGQSRGRTSICWCRPANRFRPRVWRRRRC